MSLVNKITQSGYDTEFTTSDYANAYENFNYSGGNPDGILQSIYRYFQDHERRLTRNVIFRGFSASLNTNQLIIDISGTDPAEAVVAGRVAVMSSQKVFSESSFSEGTNFVSIKTSTLSESSTRDGSSESFSWDISTSLSSIDDTYLVICSVDKTGTTLSNVVQLAHQYEVESNKYRPKYGHSLSFYVGDGDSQLRALSTLMDYNQITFYLPIKVDTITEETSDSGVTIEGMLIKDITTIKADSDILYVNTIDDFSGGTLTITPSTIISGSLTCSSTTNVVGDFSVNTNKMTINATSGNATIAGTLDVTGLISSTAGFSGNITGDVTGNADTATAWETARTLTLSGDVTGTSSSWDGSGNATLVATVVDDQHNHTLSSLDLSGDTGITSVGTIVTGTWQGDPITHNYLATINQDLLTSSSPSFVTVMADLIGDVSGNASSASQADKLTTARTFSLSGDVTATSKSFDGTSDIAFNDIAVTDDSHNHSTSTITDINQSLRTSDTVQFADVTITNGVWRNISLYGNRYRNISNLNFKNTDDYLETTITLASATGYGYIDLSSKTKTIQVQGVMAGEVDGGTAGYTARITLQKRTTSGTWTGIGNDSLSDSCTTETSCTFGPTTFTLTITLTPETISGNEGYRIFFEVTKDGTATLSNSYCRFYGLAVKEWY